MSFSGQYNTCRGSFRRFNKGSKKMRPVNLVENLKAASERLYDVQIENRDALRLIKETDSPDTLFYLDPPYVFSTRTTSKAYSHEMCDDAHREFAELLYSLEGFVVLSGYPSKIYEELFEAKRLASLGPTGASSGRRNEDRIGLDFAENRCRAWIITGNSNS